VFAVHYHVYFVEDFIISDKS